MKKLLLLFVIVFVSCSKEQYPKYELCRVKYVPDSLKEKQRQFITETVRAATYSLSTADYEDVDETIQQARYTSEDVYAVEVIGLRVIYNEESFFNNEEIAPEHMTEQEKAIFNKLRKGVQ